MGPSKVKRESHCSICGKRLSAKTPSGDIRWKPSHIDDKGLLCLACFSEKAKDPQNKKRG
jgi:hypothetical protein